MTPLIHLPNLRWIADIASHHLSTISGATARALRLSRVPDVFGSGDGRSDPRHFTLGSQSASKSATARPSTCGKCGAGSVRMDASSSGARIPPHPLTPTPPNKFGGEGS